MVAGRDAARIFADACLWVQEAQTAEDVLRRANDAARLLVQTSCSYCAVRDGDVLRLSPTRGSETRRPRDCGDCRSARGSGAGWPSAANPSAFVTISMTPGASGTRRW